MLELSRSQRHHRREQINFLLGLLCCSILGIAGIMKLLSFDEWSASLDTWTLVPDVGLPLLAVAVPLWEMLIFTSFFALRVRTRLLAIAAGTYLAFAIVAALHAVAGVDAACSCFGEATAALAIERTTADVSWQAGGLAILSGVSAVGAARQTYGQSARASSAMEHADT